VPRREMLDAAFPVLEADYHAVLGRQGRERAAGSSEQRRPRRPPRPRAASRV
jgi:hypothetical protein